MWSIVAPTRVIVFSLLLLGFSEHFGQSRFVALLILKLLSIPTSTNRIFSWTSLHRTAYVIGWKATSHIQRLMSLADKWLLNKEVPDSCISSQSKRISQKFTRIPQPILQQPFTFYHFPLSSTTFFRNGLVSVRVSSGLWWMWEKLMITLQISIKLKRKKARWSLSEWETTLTLWAPHKKYSSFTATTDNCTRETLQK